MNGSAIGTLNGVAFEASIGAKSVYGVDDAPPYAYAFITPFGSAPQVAVVTQAAMIGGDGGWAQTHGATQATTASLLLSISTKISSATRSGSTRRSECST